VQNSANYLIQSRTSGTIVTDTRCGFSLQKRRIQQIKWRPDWMHSPVVREKLPRDVGKTAISCRTNAFKKRTINSWIIWKVCTNFTTEHVCSFIHSFAIRISYLIMYVISWTTPFVSFFSNVIPDSTYCQALLYTNGRTEQLMNTTMFTKRRENYLRHHVSSKHSDSGYAIGRRCLPHWTIPPDIFFYLASAGVTNDAAFRLSTVVNTRLPISTRYSSESKHRRLTWLEDTVCVLIIIPKAFRWYNE